MLSTQLEDENKESIEIEQNKFTTNSKGTRKDLNDHVNQVKEPNEASSYLTSNRDFKNIMADSFNLKQIHFCTGR